jgi:hypothetical protein
VTDCEALQREAEPCGVDQTLTVEGPQDTPQLGSLNAQHTAELVEAKTSSLHLIGGHSMDHVDRNSFTLGSMVLTVFTATFHDIDSLFVH